MYIYYTYSQTHTKLMKPHKTNVDIKPASRKIFRTFPTPTKSFVFSSLHY